MPCTWEDVREPSQVSRTDGSRWKQLIPTTFSIPPLLGRGNLWSQEVWETALQVRPVCVQDVRVAFALVS